MIPPFRRYIEPFFGGGALFFHLQPDRAAINDRSETLIDFYKLIKRRDSELYSLLTLYNSGFSGLLQACRDNFNEILMFYQNSGSNYSNGVLADIHLLVRKIMDSLDKTFYSKLVLNKDEFTEYLCDSAINKFSRTHEYNKSRPFSDKDLKNNLITGFSGGFYMYFRKILNDIALKRIASPSLAYTTANFFFIREYCYGSMFRYNQTGEFNIPYGGVTYNGKNFLLKIENLFDAQTAKLFHNTDIACLDFEAFLEQTALTKDDFIFLDPPYDTDFSDYEGADFTRLDQIRLCEYLKKIPAKFILIIKNTDFIYGLYKDFFSIRTFDNHYTYNIRSRNERKAEHLVITNY